MEKYDETEKLLWSLFDKKFRSSNTVNEALRSLDMTIKGLVIYYLALVLIHLLLSSRY